MMPILRLIRFPNLIVVALTQWILYRLFPSPQLSSFYLWCLVGTTVSITAAGYVINDIIDYKIDLINKSDKIIINKYITKNQAYILYFIFNIIGICFALYLSWWVETQWLGLFWGIFLSTIIFLWAYSKFLKKRFLIGNILISVFCSLVALVVYMAEDSIKPLNNAHLKSIFVYYGIFAFLSTLYREIVKDIEDKNGDAQYGCKTLPIVLGEKKAKIVTIFIAILLIICILNFNFNAIILILIVFVLLSIFLLFRANTPKDYHQVSTLIKIIMLLGLMQLLL